MPGSIYAINACSLPLSRGWVEASHADVRHFYSERKHVAGHGMRESFCKVPAADLGWVDV